MVIRLSFQNNRLIIKAITADLAPRHESQLAFWGCNYNPTQKEFICEPDNPVQLLVKLTKYFDRNGIQLEMDTKIGEILAAHIETANELSKALHLGETLKDGDLDISDTNEFLTFLKANVKRQLKEHQLKAAMHLLSVKNGANFSVPGSGKTTVVLVAFQKLRHLGAYSA